MRTRQVRSTAPNYGVIKKIEKEKEKEKEREREEEI